MIFGLPTSRQNLPQISPSTTMTDYNPEEQFGYTTNIRNNALSPKVACMASYLKTYK
jgi:hypothetical protein